MNLCESIFLFIMFVCVFAAIMFSNKAIEDLQYHIDLIKETDLEVAKVVDTNFEIVDRQIEELKGPTYGPMLEDDE